MAEFVDYEIWLGTFEGEDFVWKTIKKFNSFEKAYAFYHDYIAKQSSYTDEELKKVWSSGRLDVELRQGKKLINWAGFFSRRVADPTYDPLAEEKEAEEKGGKEAEASDAAPVSKWGIQSNTRFGVRPLVGYSFDTLAEAEAEADKMNEEGRIKGYYPDVIYEPRPLR